MGESLVAAYLRHVVKCDVILTNVHLDDVQGELDVVGLSYGPPQKVWLCEVTTHIRGMNNPAKRPAAQRVTGKVQRAAEFASKVFPEATPHFEVWSPRVRPGLIAELDEVVITGKAKGWDIELVVNEAYGDRVQQLIDTAHGKTLTTGEDAFRLLQILTRIKASEPLRLVTLRQSKTR